MTGECVKRGDGADGEPSSIAAAIHYPDCWDQAAYPTLASALHELLSEFRCTCDECPTPGVAIPQTPKEN